MVFGIEFQHIFHQNLIFSLNYFLKNIKLPSNQLIIIIKKTGLEYKKKTLVQNVFNDNSIILPYFKW